MQPSNSNNQCSSEVDIDGGRNSKQHTFDTAIGMALAKMFNLDYRQVHLAEPGKRVNLFATLDGLGGLEA